MNTPASGSNNWFLIALVPVPLMFAAAGLYNLTGGRAKVDGFGLHE
jgi:hypothetical protein